MDITDWLTLASQREKLLGLALKIDFPACAKINVGCFTQVGCAAVGGGVAGVGNILWSKKSLYGIDTAPAHYMGEPHSSKALEFKSH